MNDDRQAQLLMQYVEHLKHDPNAAPPAGLDPEIATLTRALMQRSTSRRARIWQHTLTQLKTPKNTGVFPMIQTSSVRTRTTPRVPLTLIAALLVMIFGITLFAMPRYRGEVSPFGAQVAAVTVGTVLPTDTPTRTPTPTPTAIPPITGIIEAQEAVNLREGPGLSFGEFVTLNPGISVIVLGTSEDGNWLNVRLEDGREGWLRSELVKVQLPPTPISTPTPAPRIITNTPTFTPQSSSEGTILLPTINADGTDVTRVVIARDPIQRGTQITEAMLTVALLPGDLLPEQTTDQTDLLIGSYAAVDLTRWQPVTLNDVQPAYPNGECILPRGVSYPVEYPLELLLALHITLKPGARVALWIGANFEGVEYPVPARVVVDAEVLCLQDGKAMFVMDDYGARTQLVNLREANVPIAVAPVTLKTNNVHDPRWSNP